jgi:hypothetical protein
MLVTKLSPNLRLTKGLVWHLTTASPLLGVSPGLTGLATK